MPEPAEPPGYQRPSEPSPPGGPPRAHRHRRRPGHYARREMPDRRLFETTQLLGALPRPTLERLRSASRSRMIARNEVVFHQGDPCHELFGIVTGRVAILTRSPDGRESLVAVLEEGALFGELGLFDDGPRSADARALEPTQVLVLEYPAVRAALQEHPQLLWVIVRVLARRLRSTDESLADSVFLDVPARTAKRLLELSADQDEFRLPMTQEDLAGLVGRVTRAGQQGAVAVREAGLDRGPGTQPLPHPRPRRAPGPQRAVAATGISLAGGTRARGARRRRHRQVGAPAVRARARRRGPLPGRPRSRSRVDSPTRPGARRCRPGV